MAEKVDLCTQRLDRAHKLIGGLGDEKDRWGETVTQFDKLLVNVIGDVRKILFGHRPQQLIHCTQRLASPCRSHTHHRFLVGQ